MLILQKSTSQAHQKRKGKKRKAVVKYIRKEKKRKEKRRKEKKSTSQAHQKRKAVVKYIRKEKRREEKRRKEKQLSFTSEKKINCEEHQLSDRGKSKIVIKLKFLSNTTKVIENVTNTRVTIVEQHYCMKQSQIILSPYRMYILQIMFIKSSVS